MCWGCVIQLRLRLILVLGHDNYLANFGNQSVKNVVEGAGEYELFMRGRVCQVACK